ncbi:hypothetical protein [Serratia sp. DD3]|uniref:hypothetical protein n=1 Tax=Serratia sp. DD3 TaxID=1410619 RepID=UPI0003C4FA52|nr:hypothetical protein [Serratia sp. DD3]KEY60924.1 hypothetical protein SRDD_00980 [Serratia sp. DD3]
MQQRFHGAYAPRNVINAPEIKKSIRARSKKREDTPEVAAWLVNHFYRHVIGNFQTTSPDLCLITSLGAAADLSGFKGGVPEWISKRFAANIPLYWIAPESEALLVLESRVLEFLVSRTGTSLEGKLMRITCPQALTLYEAEHRVFEARALQGWRQHSPEAINVIQTSPLGQFVELLPDSPKLRDEMAYESQMMRHCLGQFDNRQALEGGYGEHYAKSCEEGKLRLFSFRSSEQLPHITISAYVEADGRLRIDQVKGKQNCPPIARYQEEVRAFLNTLPCVPCFPPDLTAIGLAYSRQGWLAIEQVQDEDDQLQVINHAPKLAEKLRNLTPAAQWLLAAKSPAQLPNLPLSPYIAKILGIPPC